MARLLIVEDNLELASLLAAAAKSRGHGVQVAHTGEGALATLAPDVFDAAIVDLLLPDIRGSEVLLALRAMGTPAIATSGVYKGSRYAQEATERHGAVAFFEKPFELAALFESLERLCHLPAAATYAEEPHAEDMELEELHPLEDDEEEAAEGAAFEGEEEPHFMPFATREQVWAQEPIAPARLRVAPEWTRAGTLTPGGVARLFNAFYQSRLDGELKLQQGSVVKVLGFVKGSLAYGASNLAHERFARFCERRGLLSENDRSSVLALGQEAQVPVGEAMLRLGLINEEQRRHLLEEQLSEIAGSLLEWTHGAYGFNPQSKAPSRSFSPRIFPGELILGAVLKHETLLTLRQTLTPQRRFFPNADAPYPLYELKLNGPQAQLLASADGSKTVEDLTTLSDLSERDALAALRAFELLGLIEERREEPSPRRRISYGL